MTTSVIGYLLRRWNPEADDRRGDYEAWADEYFHHEANAHTEAVRRNQATLSELNGRRRAAHTLAVENQAHALRCCEVLDAAGLSSPGDPAPPPTPEPYEDLTELPSYDPTPDIFGHYRAIIRWSVELFEVEWQDDGPEEPETVIDEPTDPGLPWKTTRWWRVVAPNGSVWCETSRLDEARERTRPGDTLQRLWQQRPQAEWRDAGPL